MKHLYPIVAISFTLIFGIAIFFKVFGTAFFDPTKVLAKIPISVGNKVAPIPVLKVENVVINNKKDISPAQVKRSIGSSVGGYGVSPKYDLVEYQMQWKISVEDGSLAPVMAQVFVPVLKDDKQQQFPVIVYGAGTTGLADRCAPSREDLARGNMGDYRNYMISEASQGYIVVMPNYEGFDNPARNQHYFNKDNEARSMLSAGKALVKNAAANNIPAKPEALFFGGYSQGGHAAFAAADYANTYIPDVKVAGIYGHGPTTNIAEYLKTNPNLAAYFFASYSQYYPDINPKIILTPKWIGLLANAQKYCVDEAFGINSTSVSDVFTVSFKTALLNNTLDKDFPEVGKIFEENNAGTSYVGIPTMIVQGTTDPVVTDKVQGVFVDQLCKRGVSVDLKEYKGIHHFYTRQVSFHDTNDWIDTVSAGKITNNSCLTRI